MISIIVPVYNVEKYLCKCLDSLLHQIYQDFEVIMVDDGSQDSSGKICDKYAENYSHFQVIHKKNNGLGMARNTGMEYATGEYILFIDSDDYLDDDFLVKIYDTLKSNNCDTCKTCFRRINEKGIKSIENQILNEVIYKDEDITKKLLPRMIGSSPTIKDAIPMSVCCTIYSMDIIRKYELKFVSEREWISEDILFNIQYYSVAQKVILSNYIGYNYRVNMNSLTTTYKKNRFEKSILMYLKEQELLKNMGLLETCQYRLDRQFFIYTKMSLEQMKNSELSKRNKINEIKYICNSEILRNIIKEYPIQKLGIKHKIFLYMLKNKMTYFLYLLMCK